MSVSREVELKLEMPVAEVVRVQRSLRRRLGEGIKRHLISVYFDTGKRALRKQGLTLRIRTGGKHTVQIVKAVDTTSASIFDRLEWQTEVEGDKLDLKAAARTPVGDVLHGSRASERLLPIFETVMDRTTWRVRQGGSEIEVALDEGRVSAHGSTQPIAELELDLKRGSSSDLFALASSLDHVKDLKIGVLSKSERGYVLADGDGPSSFKAEPIALRPNLSAAAAVQIIARACIRHFRLNEPLLIASRSAEPLHLARVAVRRLRSALSLFEAMVTDQEYKRLKRRLRENDGHPPSLEVERHLVDLLEPGLALKAGLEPDVFQDGDIQQVLEARLMEAVQIGVFEHAGRVVASDIKMALENDAILRERAGLVGANTSIAPKFWIESSRLTMTFRRDIAARPCPRVTVTIMGSISGVSPPPGRPRTAAPRANRPW